MSNHLDQETILRVKLDELTLVIKKLAGAFLHSESETATALVEPQIINKLIGLLGGIDKLRTLGQDEGDIFVSFLKTLTDTIQDITPPRNQTKKQNPEESLKIMKSLRNLEETIKEFLPVIRSIDEERKKNNYETFGSLLQKLIDAIQEKRHLISRKNDDK